MFDNSNCTRMKSMKTVKYLGVIIAQVLKWRYSYCNYSKEN